MVTLELYVFYQVQHSAELLHPEAHIFKSV